MDMTNICFDFSILAGQVLKSDQRQKIDETRAIKQ